VREEISSGTGNPQRFTTGFAIGAGIVSAASIMLKLKGRRKPPKY